MSGGLVAKAQCAAGMVVVAVFAAGCGSPPPSPLTEERPATVAPPQVQPELPPQTPAASAPDLPPAAPVARLAARDPTLDQWKRTAAERIHQANATRLFAGRPHHLLQAVIVVEVAVDKAGAVTRSKILRSPGIAALDKLALASLRAASPLPTPPARLLGRGTLVYSETWLFDNEGRFQLRSLALPQD
jgi:periplasmic protein TonB